MMGLFDVRFDEPQEFVEIAGSGSKDIRGIFVFCFASCAKEYVILFLKQGVAKLARFFHYTYRSRRGSPRG